MAYPPRVTTACAGEMMHRHGPASGERAVAITRTAAAMEARSRPRSGCGGEMKPSGGADELSSATFVLYYLRPGRG